MRYLIDTDWVIDHMHHVAGVSHRLEELVPRGIGISVVSLAEIYEGVFYSTDPDGNERALRELINQSYGHTRANSAGRAELRAGA